MSASSAPAQFHLNRIGPTPLVPVSLDADHPPIYCKLEYLNPSGSTKDRVARFILEKAWRERRLGPGYTVIEASSGSTSIALALVCAQLGLRFIAVMPEGVSNERVLMIRGYGGEIRLTPKQEGIRGAMCEVARLGQASKTFLPDQFANPDNALAHQIGTAREILEQIPHGTVDGIAVGVGTGGTLVGLYQGLKAAGCPVVPFLARPIEMNGDYEAECCSFSSCIPGVVDSISTLFRPSEMPELQTIEISDEEAIRTTRRLILLGFPVGPSSGLNYLASVLAARRLGPGRHVVTVFPDRMERYFTTQLFAPFRT